MTCSSEARLHSEAKEVVSHGNLILVCRTQDVSIEIKAPVPALSRVLKHEVILRSTVAVPPLAAISCLILTRISITTQDSGSWPGMLGYALHFDTLDPCWPRRGHCSNRWQYKYWTVAVVGSMRLVFSAGHD